MNRHVTSLIFLAFYLSLTGLTGCATITRGIKDTLIVETKPPGAAVTLSTGLSGVTPCSFKLPRNKVVTVRIEKDGYVPADIEVTPQLTSAGSAAMAGNIIMIGGFIGACLDICTGAMHDLLPNPISLTLKKREKTLAKDGAYSRKKSEPNKQPHAQ